jgi:hypothetical protein
MINEQFLILTEENMENAKRKYDLEDRLVEFAGKVIELFSLGLRGYGSQVPA